METTFKETAECSWKCPACECKNTIFALENEPLPDSLECSFCGYESGEIFNWYLVTKN